MSLPVGVISDGDEVVSHGLVGQLMQYGANRVKPAVDDN